MAIEYDQVIALASDTKMAAATEVGAVPLPSLLQTYQAHWLYFCTWGDSFINNEEWNSHSVLTEVRYAPTCLQSQLPSLTVLGVRRRVCPHAGRDPGLAGLRVTRSWGKQ